MSRGAFQKTTIIGLGDVSQECLSKTGMTLAMSYKTGAILEQVKPQTKLYREEQRLVPVTN